MATPVKTTKPTKSYDLGNSAALLAKAKSLSAEGITKPKGEVLGAATSQDLTNLSIGLANGDKTRQHESSLLKEFSQMSAKGGEVTQDQINQARTAGSSLASVQRTATASPSTGASTGGGSSPVGGGKSNQTGVGGGYYSRYSKEEQPVVEEPDYEKIQKDLMRDAQKEVNSLYKYQRSLLEEQQGINQENLQQVSSVNTLTGLAGSTEANRTTQAQQNLNQQANKKIQNEINVQVQSILQKVRSDALAQFNQAKSDYRADVRLGMEQDKFTQDQQEASRLKSAENVALLASTGATAEGYKTTDPETYTKLAESVGGEDLLRAMFTLNRPQEQILDKKIEGGKYVIAYQDPLSGKTRIETLDLGLPPQYTNTIDAGDRILAIPDGWTGDPSELITINKGLTPNQKLDSTPSGGQGIYDILDFRTANAVVGQGEKFMASDIVKRFNNIQDSVNNINLIDSNTQNPADHQAIVYYFAKALDPESVVREGEYETIKKYAQNIFGRYKGEIENAVNGSGFLSQSAIQNIKDTMDNRYKSGKVQYDNKARETARVINTIAGKDVAGMVLQDFAGGAIGGNQGGQSKQLKAPDGQVYDASELTPQEYQDALAEGYQPA